MFWGVFVVVLAAHSYPAASQATQLLHTTSAAQSDGSSVFIGEVATFTTAITMPESPSVLEVIFTLPSRDDSLLLRPIQNVEISSGANLRQSGSGSIVPTSSTQLENVLVLRFGSISNIPDTVSNSSDTLTLTLTCVVADVIPPPEAGVILTLATVVTLNVINQSRLTTNVTIVRTPELDSASALFTLVDPSAIATTSTSLSFAVFRDTPSLELVAKLDSVTPITLVGCDGSLAVFSDNTKASANPFYVCAQLTSLAEGSHTITISSAHSPTVLAQYQWMVDLTAPRLSFPSLSASNVIVIGASAPSLPFVLASDELVSTVMCRVEQYQLPSWGVCCVSSFAEELGCVQACSAGQSLPAS